MQTKTLKERNIISSYHHITYQERKTMAMQGNPLKISIPNSSYPKQCFFSLFFLVGRKLRIILIVRDPTKKGNGLSQTNRPI